MSKTRASLHILFLSLFLAATWSPIPARDKEDVQEMLTLTRAVIQVERREIIASTLNLAPDEAEIFWPLYQAYSEEIGLVKERHTQFVDDYVASYDNLTNEMASALMDRWLDLERDALQIRRTWVKRFSKQLPATTVARFFQLDNRMNVVIRAELAQLIPALK